MRSTIILAAACLLASLAGAAEPASVTIAAVNNPAMIELKKLSTKFEAANPNLKLSWVVVEENVLRQRVTTDISTGSGQFDLVFLGQYEAPIFAKAGWLREIKDIPVSYDLGDVFQSLRDGLSYEGRLYALPFYGESSMLMYRKDLFSAKGLTMPEQPTYDDIQRFAAALTDKSAGIYGITLRGKPGWGENMAYLSTLVNTFGGCWFDLQWKPQIDSPEWKNAISYYVDLMRNFGPPGATANGFNENLTLFASGKAAMWIDSTYGAGPLFDKKESQVADKVAFANAPVAVTSRGSHWLWSWSFAIPKAAKSPEAAKKFALWATSKEYIGMVAADTGWASVPPGSRKSTYDNREYRQAAPFALVTLNAMQTADPLRPSLKPVPYQGIQFVGIPAFQSFATVVGQNIAGALAGQMTVDQALKASQAAATRATQQGGYLK
jgi:sorbitol/mannitol transport system substrate-binding protein